MSTSFQPVHILIVDDEEIVRDTLAEFLDLLGHTAVQAPDGQAGLRAVKDGCFDAVLSDIRMPGMDGIAFLKEIRLIRPDIPVILITGHGSPDLQAVAEQAGACAFLHKPFRFREIEDLTDRIAAQKRSLASA